MGQIKRDCPHCYTKNSAFHAYGERVHPNNQHLYTVALYCGGCYEGISAEVHYGGGPSPVAYPGDIDASKLLNIVKTYPIPDEQGAPQHLPPNIESFFLQACRSLEGKAYDASGMMARKALEAAVKKIKPDGKGNLYSRIEVLETEHLITPDLKDWAHIIRDDGNVAAHEEEPMSLESAKELLDFTELFLMYTFTMPGMVNAKKRVDNESDQQDEGSNV